MATVLKRTCKFQCKCTCASQLGKPMWFRQNQNYLFFQNFFSDSSVIFRCWSNNFFHPSLFYYLFIYFCVCVCVCVCLGFFLTLQRCRPTQCHRALLLCLWIYLQVVRQLLTSSVAWIHCDEHGAGGIQGQLRSLEHKALQVGVHCLLNTVDLLSHDRQHLQLDAVEFVKARPRPGLRQTFEELSHGFEIKTVRTVEHNTLKTNAHVVTFNHFKMGMTDFYIKTTHQCSSCYKMQQTCLATAFAKSLHVSVLPVPAGPSGAPPKFSFNAPSKVLFAKDTWFRKRILYSSKL